MLLCSPHLQPGLHHHQHLPCPSAQRLAVVAAAKKQQAPRRRVPKGGRQQQQRQRFYDEEGLIDDEDEDELWEPPPQQQQGPGASGLLPQAPSPGVRKAPEGPAYPVFLPQQSANVKEMGKAWSWTDDGEDARGSSEPPLPEWNPQTGFMASRPAAPADDGNSSSSSSRRDSSRGSSTSGRGFGAAQGSAPQQGSLGEQEPSFGLVTPAAGAEEGDLPAVPKGRILSSCVGTSLTMSVLALFLRAYALANAPNVLGTDEALLAEFVRIPTGLGSWTNAGVLVGAATVVSLLRFTLLSSWPDFRLATDRSNKQVLTPLNWGDIALVAALTGVSEELLFRGAIIPGSFLDWRGVLLSGVIFGLLHNSGGRNPAFAAWATGVGCLYGGAFLLTHNIWVPAVAHSVANFVSAAVWKARSLPTERTF